MDDFTADFPVGMFGFGLIVFLLFFAAAFVFVFVVIAFAIGKGLTQWNRNNHAPLIAVPASVVAKRGHVSGGSGDSSATTSYYVTFEVRGGERHELQVSGPEFGTLIEGDRGQLRMQGTRFKGMDRTPRDL
jgi:hypothetical protein